MDIKFVEKSDITLEEASEVVSKLDCAAMFLQPQPRLATNIHDELSSESLEKVAKQLAWKSHDPNVYVPMPSFIPEPKTDCKEREE